MWNFYIRFSFFFFQPNGNSLSLSLSSCSSLSHSSSFLFRSATEKRRRWRREPKLDGVRPFSGQNGRIPVGWPGSGCSQPFWPGIRSFPARTAESWAAGQDSALSQPERAGRDSIVLAGDPVLPGQILAGIRPFPGQNGRIGYQVVGGRKWKGKRKGKNKKSDVECRIRLWGFGCEGLCVSVAALLPFFLINY